MRALILALATLSMACGPFHRGPSTGATLVFNNQSIDQADIYATTGASDPVRIGTVLAGQTATINVPATYVASGSQVNIRAHLLAGPNVSTGLFSLGAGQTAELRLPPDARNIIIVSIH